MEAEEKDRVERFTVNGEPPTLVDLVPGTTPQHWYRSLARELVDRGVLLKRGHAWYGRRRDIEAALTPGAGRKAAP